MYRPTRGDVRAVREYISDVTSGLRREMCLQGLKTGEVLDVDFHAAWQLRSCSIRRLHQVDSDGSAMPFIVPHLRKARDGVKEPEPKHIEVFATLNVHNISFEAKYYCRGLTTTWVSLYGEVDVVPLEVVIGKSERPGHVPVLKMFQVKEIGPLDFGGWDSNGIRDVDNLKDATKGLVRKCILDTMTARVPPVVNDVLRSIPFPTFASGQE